MKTVKPLAPIRRFDVFAEFNRLKAIEEGMSPAQAKGYGLWLAKVVAAQKFGRLPKHERPDREAAEELEERIKERRWHELSGVPQTDKLFDKEIINRMGRYFYQSVFSPAIKAAVQKGQEYREIRDSIRKEWKPER